VIDCNEKELSELVAEITKNLAGKFSDFSNEMVSVMDLLGWKFILESRDETTLRFIWKQGTGVSLSHLICFDLIVSVFIEEDPRTEGDAPVAVLLASGPEGRDWQKYLKSNFENVFEFERIVPGGLVVNLQNYLESCLCLYLQNQIETIIDNLELENNNLRRLAAEFPQIEYEDRISGLHVRFGCIATRARNLTC